MDLNLIPIYPKQKINKIFPDINFDNFNYNAETNLMTEDCIINDNLEQFDKLFNEKKSRNSSFDENDLQKTFLYKSNLNTPSSGLKFNFNKKESNNIDNNNNNIENHDNKNVDIKKSKVNKKIIFNSFQTNTFKEIQNQKQKQKMKNKLSARKSRLKKKLYIEKLEKEYILVKKELEEIKHKISLNPINNNNLAINEKDKLIRKLYVKII